MKTLIRGRGNGKTTEMLKWLKACPEAVLLCLNEPYAVFTREHAKRIFPHWNSDDLQKRIIGFGSQDRLKGTEWRVIVDNADLFLERFVGRQIDLVSMSGELYEPRE